MVAAGEGFVEGGNGCFVCIHGDLGCDASGDEPRESGRPKVEFPYRESTIYETIDCEIIHKP